MFFSLGFGSHHNGYITCCALFDLVCILKTAIVCMGLFRDSILRFFASMIRIVTLDRQFQPLVNCYHQYFCFHVKHIWTIFIYWNANLGIYGGCYDSQDTEVSDYHRVRSLALYVLELALAFFSTVSLQLWIPRITVEY